ncbi:hypothetical protein K0M31_003453 [Melipona bicolor]|uniref:Uncharacterized protein n=1 Tax=Melipona bicolor TaxID=60889 RepID=A0AA40KPK4_9HYME|nr:hypothetical protein K0M31_003453 [Melipona bicolor]
MRPCHHESNCTHDTWTTTWTTVLGRMAKRNTKRNEVESQRQQQSQREEPRVRKPERRKSRPLGVPRRSAVTLTIAPGSKITYAEVMSRAKNSINLSDARIPRYACSSVPRRNHLRDPWKR